MRLRKNTTTERLLFGDACLVAVGCDNNNMRWIDAEIDKAFDRSLDERIVFVKTAELFGALVVANWEKACALSSSDYGDPCVNVLIFHLKALPFGKI